MSEYDPPVGNLQEAYVQTITVLNTLDRMEEEGKDHEVNKGDLIAAASNLRTSITDLEGPEAVPDL
jgi:hypothetical protein